MNGNAKKKQEQSNHPGHVQSGNLYVDANVDEEGEIPVESSMKKTKSDYLIKRLQQEIYQIHLRVNGCKVQGQEKQLPYLIPVDNLCKPSARIPFRQSTEERNLSFQYHSSNPLYLTIAKTGQFFHETLKVTHI